MPLSHQAWHNRYQIQARWTYPLRTHFFDLLKSQPPKRILDIGCGTGALIQDIQNLTAAEIFGGDILLEHLEIAKENNPDSHFLGTDVHHLPFNDGAFDLVLCHYFLMWTGDPSAALKEMHRVTADNGYVAAFAEPDYGGRIDYPPEFIKIRDFQIAGLLRAGANPRMGRELKSLFSAGGFTGITCGVYEGSWQGEPSPDEIESEWQVLKEDLAGQLSAAEIAALKKHEMGVRKKGARLIYVPTFYCWGKAAV